MTQPFISKIRAPDASLLPAEALLLSSLKSETKCVFPKQLDNKNHYKIRSSFLRKVILNKIPECKIPPKGLVIHNAFIVGGIDLCGCEISHSIEMQNCKILGILDLSQAKIQTLVLRGTSVERLLLDQIEVSGNIILSYGFSTLHPVSVRGAKIKRQLGCSGGEFKGYPVAINLEAAKIEEAFFWRRIVGLWGVVDLTNASVGILADDPDSWPRKGDLRLAGFTYGALSSNTDYSYYNRLGWLNRQFSPHLNEDFRPQPFEQLIFVLKKSGRENESKNIAIEKLHYQRNANFNRRNLNLINRKSELSVASNLMNKIILEMLIDLESKTSIKNIYLWVKASFSWVISYMFWAVAGYGYRPMRCIGWSIILIIMGSIIFSYQYGAGNLVSLNNTARADGFTATDFHSIAFAADTFIPIVDLKQASFWTLNEVPNQDHQPFLIFYWFYIFMGWVLTAIFGASITRLVRK